MAEEGQESNNITVTEILPAMTPVAARYMVDVRATKMDLLFLGVHSLISVTANAYVPATLKRRNQRK